MPNEYVLITRIVIAGLLGGIIGAERGIEVVGPVAVEEGEAVHREYVRRGNTVYVPNRDC